ncbi:hypothetical protein [Mycobacteroides abscessus]|uniref:hypothetical protein n=1 Tax=Mycobacteroides abscessus TaxID=36809 RepID=UPI0009296E68|nr:hypothetical protein [Mycobacteroides abscessus]SHX81766.1 Uncharacterised protein [Mycobacteroides abscessus subsp. abscessus]SKM69650.1 Uncharacterised protein [Mycobacteroides abscessus subsp. abscessus]SKN72765.1 Uncharacterised protein [Mycobacteroides abscessus subsp. abscessus]SLL20168.1 Uncharacterised protein [Mycobacteroides abscessus subsp. abscessus]
MSDLKKPTDPFSLVGDSWPSESESAYHKAKVVADDAATTASTQAQSARDAESRMSDEQGKTASAVSSGYGSAASDLQEESITYATISAWMTDAEGKIRSAKTSISDLVSVGTVEVREALDSEVKGVPATPSSSELIAKYQGEIASVKTKLGVELDGIGHSLHGDPGASRTPSYTSIPTTPTPEHADPHASMASYTATPGAPVPEPHQLPPMPRATSPSTTESPSAPSVPVAPHSVNPTLSNLIGGQGAPTGTPSASSPGSTSATHTPSPSTPSLQAHQQSEHRQTSKPAGLPHIPLIPLDGLPIANTESITTVVASATAHQLPTQAPSTPSVPASTGFTPGTPGTPPMAPMAPVTPGGLSPIGGGGGLTPPAVQPVTPAPQAAPASPSPAPQQPTAPSPTRGAVVDAAWLQQRYGLAPGVELPKSEPLSVPALFITNLPESEAHLHRALATLRQEFERSGWGQPLAVATMRRGLESHTVYVTSDGVSIHPREVSLPAGVTPLDDMSGAPTHPELSGSLMVSDKLKSLLPRGWDIEELLSTAPADEHHQSAEQLQELVGAGELLECTVSRGRGDVEVGEAMGTFARAALGSEGCSDLDVESVRLRAARWVGTQPVGYEGVLSRYHLADAADAMSQGAWGDALYASEKYMSVNQARSQAA